MPSILTERDGPILRVTLNRPEVRNAFDEEVIASLTALVSDAAQDQSLRAVVLAGSGSWSMAANIRDIAVASRRFSASV